MKGKKVLSLVMAVLMVGFVFVGCTVPEEGGEAEPEQQQEQPLEEQNNDLD